MRSVPGPLRTALDAGRGSPIAIAHVGYSDGTVLYSCAVTRFKLTATTLELEIPYTADFGGDQTHVWLERGLQVAGSDYTITTGRFFILEQEYNERQSQVIKGSLFPKQFYTAPGDVTYQTAIDAFCAAFGKSTVYYDPYEAWLGYQFLPAGKSIIMNDANRFLNLIEQKRLIFLADNGNEQVLVYSADVMGAASFTIPVKDQFSVNFTDLRTRQFIWRDELETVHTDGPAAAPIHNLGYLESTDLPPARHSPLSEAQAVLRPDLRIMDGDIVALSLYGGSVTSSMFAQVTEIYETNSRKDPPWRMVLTANPIYHTTEGGALPSTIERVSNYTPLNTSMFADVLSSSDNNLQAAMDTLDDHEHTQSDIWVAHGNLATVPAASTYYMTPFCTWVQATELAMGCPRAATIRNFYFRTAGNIPADGDTVIRIRVEGVNTTIVITFPAGTAGPVTMSDLTRTAAITAGQRISISIQNLSPANPTPGIGFLSFQLDLPTT